MKAIVYDCEIKKAIPSAKEPQDFGIEYCKGWRDFPNMGCSMISVFDFNTLMPRLFAGDNMIEFFELCENSELVIGFNNNNFDDHLLAEMGVKLTPHMNGGKSFDLLRAIWKSVGLDPTSYGYHHNGYGLDDLSVANLGFGKLGTGAHAALLYQRGEYGKLFDYGLRDIMLTTWLLCLAAKQPILNPKLPGERLHVEIPFDLPSISP